MPLRQEQEDASDEIIEVAPGIRRVQLPIHMPGLGHVNCYAMEDSRGFAVMDPGLPSDEAFRELEEAFGRADIPLEKVHTVVITHSHPDHFGGAMRIRARSGADIVTHRDFRLVFEMDDDGDAALNDGVEANRTGDAPQIRSPFGMETPWGGDTYQPMNTAERDRILNNMRDPLARPRPTVRLDEADAISLAGRRFVALHTPGHTADHLCLYDAETGVLFSGDHVLPTITPHISGMHHGEDPLNAYFESLRHVQTLAGVKTVLPAHGHPFGNLSDRVEEIIEHHLERLGMLARGQVELGRPGTVNEFMKFLFRERSWGSMAESETYAHLEHLRRSGQATTERHDGVMYFDVARNDHV